MTEHKHAVVVGALGVIGRYIVARLLEQGDWSVVGLSRRSADAAPRYRHIAVDLLDAKAAAEKLSGLKDATHIFYAAFQPAPGAAAGYASNIAPNRDMLVNAVTAIDRASHRAASRGAGHRHEILRLASRRLTKRRRARAIRVTRVPTIISTRSTGSPHSSAAKAGTGWSCGRRLCAALRRARR